MGSVYMYTSIHGLWAGAKRDSKEQVKKYGLPVPAFVQKEEISPTST